MLCGIEIVGLTSTRERQGALTLSILSSLSGLSNHMKPSTRIQKKPQAARYYCAGRLRLFWLPIGSHLARMKIDPDHVRPYIWRKS